ncbi:protein kinase superfamily protein isoform X2 [Tasmannia lanceolata]|uniref:protein kinase superfamily protein isoform X2 n=1 Tax=Tasmannia lanceolata TaxID=3420 RepID=UPI0040633AA2
MKGSSKRFFKFPTKVKHPLFILTTSGIVAFTLHHANPNFIPFPEIPSSASPDKIRAGLHGVIRSSRAIYTISINVIDYKYSLRNLPPGSSDYLRELSEVHLRSAKRILKLCEANRGFYVKAGQFIAAMSHVPKEYSSTLSSLQDQAVPCPFKAIREVLVNNLGKDLSEIFLSIDEQPIAAASIAQVHHALLKDSQEVAIKVQYPGLELQMKIDITTMAILSKFVAWIFPEYRFQWMVSEFEKTISSELDFVQEAKNCERTARNFERNNVVRVPRIFWDLTQRQVLTMQFCHGHKVAKALMEVFAEMIFVHGFVHGDPHPGNILVSPEGRRGFSLVILDHGVYKELDEGFRLDYCQLWKALILLDSHKIHHLAERFGVGKYSRYFPVIFTGRTINSKSALGRGMSTEEKRNLKQDLSSLNMGDISLFMESLPSDFLTILRTDGLLRSIIRKLGVSQRVRMLAYSKYAVYGLTVKSVAESDHKVESALSKIKASISYIQLRTFIDIMDLLSQVEAFRHSLIKTLKRILYEVAHFFHGNSITIKP